jgi:hypothetical protein
MNTFRFGRYIVIDVGSPPSSNSLIDRNDRSARRRPSQMPVLVVASRGVMSTSGSPACVSPCVVTSQETAWISDEMPAWENSFRRRFFRTISSRPREARSIPLAS